MQNNWENVYESCMCTFICINFMKNGSTKFIIESEIIVIIICDTACCILPRFLPFCYRVLNNNFSMHFLNENMRCIFHSTKSMTQNYIWLFIEFTTLIAIMQKYTLSSFSIIYGHTQHTAVHYTSFIWTGMEVT